MHKLFYTLFLSVLTSMGGVIGATQLSDDNFNIAIKKVLENEGGFVDNGSDSGDATNFGVSLRFLKGLKQAGDINNDGYTDVKDIRALSKFAAANIYKKYFWDKYRLYLITDLSLATKILDLSINTGMRQTILLLKDSINLIDPHAQLNKDASFDMRLLNIYHPALLLLAIVKTANFFYMNLALKNPKYHVFLKGWLRRANDVSIESNE